MLTVFPYPITCTVVQFGVGSVMAILMWTLGLHPKPAVSKETVRFPHTAFDARIGWLLLCSLAALAGPVALSIERFKTTSSQGGVSELASLSVATLREAHSQGAGAPRELLRHGV